MADRAYKPDIVMYHYPCSDGMTAAAIVDGFYDDDSIEFVPGKYDEKDTAKLIEICRDKNLLLLDFSFSAEVTNKVAQSAKSIVIIDHHVSAKENLSDLIVGSEPTIEGIAEALKEHQVVMFYDVKHSGASLAWECFRDTDTGNTSENLFIEYIRDVDLNLFQLDGVEFFKDFTRSKQLDIPTFKELIAEGWTQGGLNKMIQAGKGVHEYVANRVQRLMAEDTRWGEFPVNDGTRFPFVITDYMLASDYATAQIKDGNDLAIAFYFTKTGIGLSIRTSKRVDAVKIARAFGGGGHAQAAGANIMWEDLADFEEAMYDYGTSLFSNHTADDDDGKEEDEDDNE